ncbi:MAG: hypothetical protein II711_04130 [Clostridia bacterium]|nr:hypothetical protein [Clostridia bacterium]
MKKLLIAVICSMMVVSLTGCMNGNRSEQLENINTADAPDSQKIKSTDFENNLSGLEKYFIELEYIPEKTEPTEMLYTVIGAVDGDRYVFTLNSSKVVMELYEYDPQNLNDDGKRVIKEVQTKGKFHVFNSDTTSDAAYDAVLSENNQYLMIYTDTSESKDNIQRQKDVKNAFSKFNGGKTSQKTESSAKSSD